MLKPIAALVALTFGVALSFPLQAQTPTMSANSQQVQLLAPQLVTFSGSTGNFDSLVSGLTTGAPVTLATVSPDGFVQIVTFVPGTTLSALDAARQLETARQNLIARGVATPTAQQLAIAVVGGTLTTATGSAALAGVLTGTPGATPIQVRNELAAFSSVGAVPTLNLSATNLQALRTALTQGTSTTLTMLSASGVTQSVSFTSPSGPMSAADVNQALQLASVLLAQQGILNPTPDQIRIALLGGTLTTASGTNIAVLGVLQARVRNTSDSPVTNTSTSPFFGTSNSPATIGAVPTPASSGATAPTPGVEGVRRPSTAEGANRAKGGG
jgi:hypothetical protein